VAVIGTNSVGKTALIVQFIFNCFIETYDPTIEDDYRKQLVVDNRMCFVEVTDTAGGEEYTTLRDQWIREAQGIILVYSVDYRLSFERLEIFHQAVLRVKRGHAIFMLVGNKCDKAQEREVSKADGAALARQYGCDFIETSTKTTQNVDRLFINLVRSLRQSGETKPKREPPQSAKKERKPCNCVVM